MTDQSLQRLHDLLSDRAAGLLARENEAELAALLAQFPGEENAFDLAAAALDLAWNDPAHDKGEGIPPALTQKLKNDADGYFASVEAARVVPIAEAPRRGAAKAQTPRRGSSLPWLAAAALVLIMLGGWWNSVRQTVEQDLAERTPEELREILLAESEDVVLTPLTATADPSAVDAGGEVSWSPVLQAGYMTIVGLEPNDPAKSQYQLWIFDATRDERYPVDGGVFDVPGGGGEVVIPIDAKIKVREATLFAITVEKPGGVVVSDRERIVLVAQPE